MAKKFSKDAWRIVAMAAMASGAMVWLTAVAGEAKKTRCDGEGEAKAISLAIDATKAEMMGRVEDVFMKNFKDITWRKSLEWGEVVTSADGSRSIRYMAKVRIWDRQTMILNEIYSFDKSGASIGRKSVEGWPKKDEAKVVDVKTQDGLKVLVEEFFAKNYRDITARKTIAWGEPVVEKDGTVSIHYTYEATIRNKDVVVNEQIFTFTSTGEFVKVVNVKK